MISNPESSPQSGPDPELASVFAALGDTTRLELMRRLQANGALPLRALAEDLPMSRQGVSKHLGQLVAAGVVAVERVGRESQYRYRAAGVVAAQAYLARVSAQWDAAIGRLTDHLEEDVR